MASSTEVDGGCQGYRRQCGVTTTEESDCEIRMGLGDDGHVGAAWQFEGRQVRCQRTGVVPDVAPGAADRKTTACIEEVDAGAGLGCIVFLEDFGARDAAGRASSARQRLFRASDSDFCPYSGTIAPLFRVRRALVPHAWPMSPGRMISDEDHTCRRPGR